MTHDWIGWTAPAHRGELVRALGTVDALGRLTLAADAEDLRLRVLRGDPLAHGVIVGLSDEGVSDVNLAAAVVHDGAAASVVLVTREASGSLRSRAAQAGIDVVLSMEDVEVEAAAGGGVRQEGTGSPRVDPSPSAAAEGGQLASAGSPASTGSPAPTAVPVPAVDPAPAPDPLAGLPQGPRAPVLTFASGRGGVGKTTLVAACACVADRWGMRVAAVDLDLSCGNLYGCLGVARPVDLARLGGERPPTVETMGRSCARAGERIALWGPCEKPEMAETVMPHVGRLLEYLARRYDLVLVDTSTTFTDAVAEASQRADRVLLVHDDAPGSLASAARASSLEIRLGVARTRIVRVRNLADPRERPGRTRESEVPVLEGQGLEGARSLRVSDGGPEVAELAAAGGLSSVTEGDDAFASSVQTMLARLLAELGALPDDDEAQERARERDRKRRRGLFSRRGDGA